MLCLLRKVIISKQINRNLWEAKDEWKLKIKLIKRDDDYYPVKLKFRGRTISRILKAYKSYVPYENIGLDFIE